jgi:hypothetical protein
MSRLQKKPPAHKRGHPTLKTWIFSTFVGHFCPPGSGSVFKLRIRIRIQWSDWIRIQYGSGSRIRIRIHNTDFANWKFSFFDKIIVRCTFYLGHVRTFLKSIWKDGYLIPHSTYSKFLSHRGGKVKCTLWELEVQNGSNLSIFWKTAFNRQILDFHCRASRRQNHWSVCLSVCLSVCS